MKKIYKIFLKSLPGEEESDDTSDDLRVQRPSEVPCKSDSNFSLDKNKTALSIVMESSQTVVERRTQDNNDNENEWHQIRDCPSRFQIRTIGDSEHIADGSVTDEIASNTVINPIFTHHEGPSEGILFLADATDREIQRNVPEGDGDETLQPIVNPPGDTRPKRPPTTELHETHAL